MTSKAFVSVCYPRGQILSYAVTLALAACGEHVDAPSSGEAPSSGGATALGGGFSPSSGGTASSGGASGGSMAFGGSSSGNTHFQSCKRGIAMSDLSPAELAAFVGSSGWFYDWGIEPPPAHSPASAHNAASESWGMEFVPMIWTGTPELNEAVSRIPLDAKYLLGFNEPNFKSQANLSAEDAAAMWPALEAIADARDLELVGPAVNFCGPESECWGTDPFDYLDAFFAACVDCRVDYIAIHGYFDNVGGLEWYLGEAKARYDLPIWLTEFNQSPGDAAAQLEFMKAAIPILEADPMVFRYSWFMARSSVTSINLLTSDGSLTELGVAYTTLPGDCVSSTP